MHSHTIDNVTFHFNGDLSGEVQIINHNRDRDEDGEKDQVNIEIDVYIKFILYLQKKYTQEYKKQYVREIL